MLGQWETPSRKLYSDLGMANVYSWVTINMVESWHLHLRFSLPFSLCFTLPSSPILCSEERRNRIKFEANTMRQCSFCFCITACLQNGRNDQGWQNVCILIPLFTLFSLSCQYENANQNAKTFNGLKKGNNVWKEPVRKTNSSHPHRCLACCLNRDFL